ncbi:basic proline-rich protein-like [Corvus cornix cornix]|uniref:basic proline-rich protein-like n=1 Tax=Corvus cornix cornix TaxID=932674 RepID=UPI0019526425|nr:basic proline-rich protein-like [Corvus cornix cornix]
MSAPPRSELAAAAAALLRLGEERPPAAAMNLLQRKGRPEWRPREEEPRKGVPKARDGGSLRRPLRVGFLTLPAPQERGPRPCAPGMAPRSLSCHAVGLPDSGVPLRPPGPRTGPPEGRGLEAPPAKRGGEWNWRGLGSAWWGWGAMEEVGAPPGGLRAADASPEALAQPPDPAVGRGPPPPLAEQGEGEEPVYIEMGASRLPLPSRREAPPPARARSHSTPLPPHHAPGGAGRERGGRGSGRCRSRLPPKPRPPESARPPTRACGGAWPREAPPRPAKMTRPYAEGAEPPPGAGRRPRRRRSPPGRSGGGRGPFPPLGDPRPGRGAPGAAGTPPSLPDLPCLRETLGAPRGSPPGPLRLHLGGAPGRGPPVPTRSPSSRPLSGGVPGGGPGGGFPAAPRPRDGQLQEVIDRKRCVCTEIKARGGRGGGLCKQDSLPPLPAPPPGKGGPLPRAAPRPRRLPAPPGPPAPRRALGHRDLTPPGCLEHPKSCPYNFGGVPKIMGGAPKDKRGGLLKWGGGATRLGRVGEKWGWVFMVC